MWFVLARVSFLKTCAFRPSIAGFGPQKVLHPLLGRDLVPDHGLFAFGRHAIFAFSRMGGRLRQPLCAPLGSRKMGSDRSSVLSHARAAQRLGRLGM
jgi:hypothetical protein